LTILLQNVNIIVDSEGGEFLSKFNLCKNEECKKSQDCLRFLSKEDVNQLYCNVDECGEVNEYECFVGVKRLKVS